MLSCVIDRMYCSRKCLVAENQTFSRTVQALFSIAAVGTATAMPASIGQHVPEGNQYNRAKQCPDNRNAANIDIAKPTDDNDLCHQPDPYEGQDNRTNEAEGESPADKEFCDETDNSRYNEIYDEISSESPGISANLNGDAICKYQTVDEEMEHVLLL